MKVKDLRQKLLNKLGGEPYKFVVKIDSKKSDEIEIIESKNQGEKHQESKEPKEKVRKVRKGKEPKEEGKKGRRKGTLCKVIIDNLPDLDFIWQINVEKKRVRVISYTG